MQQVKIFKTLEGDIAKLEGEVNAWIRQSGARIVSIAGNIAPQTPVASEPKSSGTLGPRFPESDVLLVILYEMSSD